VRPQQHPKKNKPARVDVSRAGGRSRRQRAAAGERRRARRRIGKHASAGGRRGRLWRIFPKGSKPANRFGVGVLVAVVRRQGGDDSLCHACIEHFSAKAAQRPQSQLLDSAEPGRVAGIMTGFAHPDRVRLARAILAGCCTHHDLAAAIKLKTGPLYHHIRELERAGLLVVAERNRYDLTPLGRACVFVATVLGTWNETDQGPWRTIHGMSG
jgi:hypothetical protein